MNYKKQITTIFLLVAIIFIAVLISLLNSQNSFCIGLFDCFRGLIFGAPYQYFAVPALGTLFPLFFLSFLKEAIYLAWRKFALWYLPIVGIILLLSSLNSEGNGFNPGYGFDTESLTFFFSGLFALISLAVIAITSWKLRGK